MVINKSKSLRNLQEEFTNAFSGLKIEFYRNADKDYEGSYNLLHYDLDTLVHQICPDLKEQEIRLDESLTVGEFENKASKILGINVQVFRRSKELWLQTVSTDKWTLGRQNLKGLHSLEAHNI